MHIVPRCLHKAQPSPKQNNCFYRKSIKLKCVCQPARCCKLAAARGAAGKRNQQSSTAQCHKTTYLNTAQYHKTTHFNTAQWCHNPSVQRQLLLEKQYIVTVLKQRKQILVLFSPLFYAKSFLVFQKKK